MKRILIIAEAGVNHNGDIKTAVEMVRAASKCGVDMIKFQTFRTDRLVAEHAGMAGYQKRNLGMDGPQKAMLDQLSLGEADFYRLADECGKTGIRFLSAPFDIESIHFLDRIQDMWKIPSGQITDYPYLTEIARTGKEVILSTGMSTLEETDAALDVLRTNGAGKITLLHCTTDYPARMEDVNLRAMLTLREHCRCGTGFSDHTCGTEAAIAAAALGAEVIEKHFTLDRTMRGPDQKASLEPDELTALVKAVRNVEAALGNGVKRPSEAERANIPVVRKSIVAAKKIEAGGIFTADNMTTKRPGTGISPMRWNEVAGRRAGRDFSEDELIEI